LQETSKNPQKLKSWGEFLYQQLLGGKPLKP